MEDFYTNEELKTISILNKTIEDAEKLEAVGGTPDHYAGDGEITAIDAMRSMSRGVGFPLTPIAYWWYFCAFKYLWRWTSKGGKRDLDKAVDCIGRLKEEVYGAELD